MNMTQKVEQLVETLEIKRTTMNYELITFLITSDEEMNLFMCKYFKGDKERIFFDLAEYRNDRMEENSMEYPAFLDLYSISPKLALEILFQQHVFPWVIDRINEKNVSLMHIYETSKEKLNLLRALN